MEKHKLGLICGRFQHIHKGHQLIIEESIKQCQKTIILVGSSQESETLRNPFTADFRIQLIKKIYNKPNIIIKKLPDLSNEYDISYKWGQYVIDKTIEFAGEFADIIISGNDEIRKGWFSKEQIKNTKEILIDRKGIEISATKLRGYIITNDKEKWKKYVPKQIHTEFETIRNKLLEINIYKKILKEMGEEINIEKFEKIYEKYEIEDKKIKIKNITK